MSAVICPRPRRALPAPPAPPYLVSANPIEVVKEKMWTIGNIEDNCPVFKGGMDLIHPFPQKARSVLGEKAHLALMPAAAKSSTMNRGWSRY